MTSPHRAAAHDFLRNWVTVAPALWYMIPVFSGEREVIQHEELHSHGLLAQAILIALQRAVCHGTGCTMIPEGPWSGLVSIGYLSTERQWLDSTTFNGSAEVNWDGEMLAPQGAVSALRSENPRTTITTAEAYKARPTEAKFDLDRYAPTGSACSTILKDRFSSYDGQFFQTAGIGQRLIKTEKPRTGRSRSAPVRASRSS